MKNTILRDAVRIARTKLPRHDQRDFWPHFSFIVQNNKIVEYATNVSSEPQKYFGYHERIKDGSGGRPKLHAELNCFKKAKGILDPGKYFDIINIRLSRTQGFLRLSKPCVCCHNFLKTVGCHSCYFSVDEGMGFAKVII
jgi:hypothetical protein